MCYTVNSAECTVPDYSPRQIQSELLVAEREGYTINVIEGDMTKRLPFADEKAKQFMEEEDCGMQNLLETTLNTRALGGNMDITQLSSKYHVRKLREEDIEIIYELFMGNPMFFEYCPPLATPESIRDDMKALPPGMTYEDKYYIGFFDGDKLITVIDLILHYPNKETAFIGFFMMNVQYQGKGVGSAIVEEMADCLNKNGYAFTRLGYVKGNPQSRAFWVKNHFEETGVESHTEDYTMVVMQRKNKR